MSRKILLSLLVIVSLTGGGALFGASGEAGEVSFLGTWSAPSLSDPSKPIVITILRGGKVLEKVGDYQGDGKWESDGDRVRIKWTSGWVGLLRSTSAGTFELLTWRKGSPLDGEADDIQPARRVEQPAAAP
jgi:hypothetical protein